MTGRLAVGAAWGRALWTGGKQGGGGRAVPVIKGLKRGGVGKAGRACRMGRAQQGGSGQGRAGRVAASQTGSGTS